jgi:hypothetical protein
LGSAATDRTNAIERDFHLAVLPAHQPSFNEGVLHRIGHGEPVDRAVSRATSEQAHEPKRLVIRKITDARHAKAPCRMLMAMVREDAKKNR